MKLSEKIYYCRKKSGKSQEALAEALGVSRQAVSKWETGDAEPEIGKLRLLAAEFGVTVDWLLSDEEPEDASEYSQPEEAPGESPTVEFLDAIPGFLGRMFKKFGWLYGIYVALGGAGIAVIGALARAISKSMMSSFTQSIGYAPGGGFTAYDQFGQAITDPDLLNQLGGQLGLGGYTMTATPTNPVAILGGAMIVAGIVVMIAGIILAVYLRKKSREE